MELSTAKRISGKWMIGLFSVIYVCIALHRMIYPSPYARSWDEVDFALALERFDLLAMQPHFPGYPYFVLGGMLVNRWVEDPALALSIWNVLMTTGAGIPMYLLARRYFAPVLSSLIVVYIQSFSYLGVLTTQPMSEATAVAVLWWFWWSVARGMEIRTFRDRVLLPACLFGILMGVRLSYAPFLIGLLPLLIAEWREHKGTFAIRFLLFTAVHFLFQSIWIAGLVMSEGGIGGFIVLARAFIEGHFDSWGGTVVTSDEPIALRIWRLIVLNWLWTGICGRSLQVACMYAIAVGLLALRWRSLRKMKLDSWGGWLLLMLGTYMLWALIGQNIEKPRHIAPLIGGTGFVAAIALLAGPRPDFRRQAVFVVALLTVLQGARGAVLVVKQATEMPATYQLAQALEGRAGSFYLYTWEETRVLQYLRVSFLHQRILTYTLFRQQMEGNKERTVLLTNHVLQGFEAQAGSLADQVRKVAVFESDPLFDPVYSRIELFEWTGKP